MNYARTLWMAAALACAGCPGDEQGDEQGDEHSHDEAGHTTSDGTTESGGTTTSNVTSTDDGTTSSGSTSGSEGHGTTEHHDSTGPDTGSTGHDTAGGVCEEIASGCHAMGKEIEMCHELGHEGDEMVCAEAYEMCAKVCGF